MWVDGVVFNDHGSGADRDLNVAYPVMPDDPSWMWVALLAGGDPGKLSKIQLVVRPDPNVFATPPISPASSGGGLQRKWGMHTHIGGGTLQLSEALPPSGFASLNGFFGQNDSGSGNGLFGGMGRFVYVGGELLKASGGATDCIWTDQGSDARDDGSVWAIDGSGWQNNGWRDRSTPLGRR